MPYVFSVHSSRDHTDLHSFPTRRSSDLTEENGKPFDEARREVAFATGYFSWFAEEARGVYGEIVPPPVSGKRLWVLDRKSTRLNSSHQIISYAVFCLKKKNDSASNPQLL